MRLLVVDDDPEVATLVSIFLRPHTIQAASSGEEGLQMMRQTPPDAVLLDILMPGMNGLQVLQTMKADPVLAPIPVICLSAKGQRAEVQAGIQAGADWYLVKPFDAQELRRVIDDVSAAH
jgi:DNA-binding response OmpR family regulator